MSRQPRFHRSGSWRALIVLGLLGVGAAGLPFGEEVPEQASLDSLATAHDRTRNAISDNLPAVLASLDVAELRRQERNPTGPELIKAALAVPHIDADSRSRMACVLSLSPAVQRASSRLTARDRRTIESIRKQLQKVQSVAERIAVLRRVRTQCQRVGQTNLLPGIDVGVGLLQRGALIASSSPRALQTSSTSGLQPPPMPPPPVIPRPTPVTAPPDATEVARKTSSTSGLPVIPRPTPVPAPPDKTAVALKTVGQRLRIDWSQVGVAEITGSLQGSAGGIQVAASGALLSCAAELASQAFPQVPHHPKPKRGSRSR